MAVTLTGSGGLFTILGKLFHAQNTLNTARATTVPDEVIDLIDEFENLTNTVQNQKVIDDLEIATESWQRSNVLMSKLRDVARKLLVRMVNDDVGELPDNRLRTALEELIEQMEGAGGESNPTNDVDASTAGVSSNRS